jgi:DNA-directed RNA polymerase specialized sigma24 family protein
LVTKRQSGEFAKRITTKKRKARRRKTARPSTSGAVSRHADQELINRALDRLPVEFREVMVLRELLNSTDLKKLSADIDKLEDVETSSSTIPR